MPKSHKKDSSGFLSPQIPGQRKKFLPLDGGGLPASGGAEGDQG